MKKVTQPYIPEKVLTRKEWQTKIRVARRYYFENVLSPADRPQFIRSLWKDRKVGDYQGFQQWKKVFPTLFKED